MTSQAFSQSVRDALADAETLFCVAEEVSQNCCYGSWDGPICWTCREAVRVLRTGRGLAWLNLWGDPMEHYMALVAREARLEARAAFLAVPLLRER